MSVFSANGMSECRISRRGHFLKEGYTINVTEFSLKEEGHKESIYMNIMWSRLENESHNDDCAKSQKHDHNVVCYKQSRPVLRTNKHGIGEASRAHFGDAPIRVQRDSDDKRKVSVCNIVYTRQIQGSVTALKSMWLSCSSMTVLIQR